jgi:hypothetical protein
MKKMLLFFFALTLIPWTYTEAQISLYTSDNERYEFSAIQMVAGSDCDATQIYVSELFHCILLRIPNSDLTACVPLPEVISAKSEKSGLFSFILKDYSTIKGYLLNDFLGDRKILISSDQFAGLDVFHASSVPEPGLRTSLSAQVHTKNDRITLKSIFVVDTFIFDNKRYLSEARNEISLTSDGIYFTIPIELINSLKSMVGGDQFLVRFSTEIDLTGSLHLKKAEFTDIKQTPELGLPDSLDYIVGYKGNRLYMVPLSNLKALVSNHNITKQVKACKTYMHLQGNGPGNELMVCNPEAGIPEHNPFDSYLVPVAGVLLHTGAYERLGFQPYDIKSISTGIKGGVVVETRESSKLFAGKLVTPINGSVKGAEVKLKPLVFQKYRASFRLGPKATFERPIKPTNVNANIELKSKEKRELKDVFILDRAGKDRTFRLEYGMELPVYERGLFRFLDIQNIKKGKLLKNGNWNIKTWKGNNLRGVLRFRHTDNPEIWGPPDEFDFLVGFDDSVMSFVRVDAIKEYTTENKPEFSPPLGYRGILDLTGKRRIYDGYNYKFESPDIMPASKIVKNKTSALFWLSLDLLRIIEIGAISQIQKSKGLFKVTGNLNFHATLTGAISGDILCGRFRAEPSSVINLRFKTVPKKKTILKNIMGITPVSLEIETIKGKKIIFIEAWIGDYYIKNNSPSIRHRTDFRFKNATGKKAGVPLKSINKIIFNHNSFSLINGKGETEGNILLLERVVGNREIYGGLVNDVIISRVNDFCLDLISFEIIKTVTFKGGK